MAFPQGVNFRTTLGYVTDGPDEFAEVGFAADYPVTTAQGNTVGWEVVNSGVNARDRNASNDQRLAGTVFNSPSEIDTFRIDLPSAGNYNVRFAAGENNYARSTLWDLYDSTTLLGHLTTGSTSAANHFKDATDTEYTAANWPSQNTINPQTFASSILRVKNVTSVSSFMAHLYVETQAGPPMVDQGYSVSFPVTMQYPDTVMIL
jgi:hypothetical protein